MAMAGVRRPRLVVFLLAVLVTLAGWRASKLEINTDRYDMVDSDDPYQSRLVGFFQRFGYPDGPVLVVRGGDDAQRRAVVLDLVRELSALDGLEHRVLGRVDARTVAEVLLVRNPQVIRRLSEAGGQGTELADLLELGLAGAAKILEAEILGGLDGVATSLPSSATADDFTQIAEMAARLKRAIQVEDAAKGVAMDALWSADLDAAGTTTAERFGLDPAGFLVADADTHLVAIFPDLPDNQIATLSALVEPIRRVRDQVVRRTTGATADIDVLLTGIPVLTVDEHALVSIGLVESSVATALGITVLLLLAFRSLHILSEAVLPLSLGMVVTAGAVQLIYGELNPITAGMFALLLGLGVDFSIHLLARFHEGLRQNVPRELALRHAYMSAGPGMLTGALTTVLVFLTITRAEFTAFGQLAVNSAIGIVVIFFITVLALPVFVARGPGRERRPPPVVFGVRLLPRTMRRVPNLVIISALFAAAAGLAMLPRLNFNTRYFDFMPQSIESSRALRILEDTPRANPVSAYVSAENVAAARELAQRLRKLPTVGHVQTLTDLLPRLTDDRLGLLRSALADAGRTPRFDALLGRADSNTNRFANALRGVGDAIDESCFALQHGGTSAQACLHAKSAVDDLEAEVRGLDQAGRVRLSDVERSLFGVLARAWSSATRVASRGVYSPADIPAHLVHRFLARDGSPAVALFVYPQDSIWDQGYASVFANDVRTLDPNAAGHAITMHVHNRMIVQDFKIAALVAAVIIIIVMLVDFRRPTDALLAVLPVAVGWAWMLGVMSATGLSLNAANIVALPLVLGIGVDAGVHMMHRCRQSEAAHGGKARLEEIVEGTGAAVFVASLTTIIGFAGLLIPDHGGMQSLGQVMMLGTACSLTASVLVLPAVLLRLGRAR